MSSDPRIEAEAAREARILAQYSKLFRYNIRKAKEPGFAYFVWRNGSLSRLHKLHPKWEGFTWCGAWLKVSRALGVSEVFIGPPFPSEPGLDELELCAECVGGKNPAHFVPEAEIEARKERNRMHARERKERLRQEQPDAEVNTTEGNGAGEARNARAAGPGAPAKTAKRPHRARHPWRVYGSF